MQMLQKELATTRNSPVFVEMLEEILACLELISQDERESGEEVHCLRQQIAIDLNVTVRAARAGPLGPEDKFHKLPHCLDYSESERAQLRRWITQLRMVIHRKRGYFPDEQSTMRHVFH